MTKEQEKRFWRELKKRSNKRVPNMRMTFAELAALNESYIRRLQEDREVELALTSKRGHR